MQEETIRGGSFNVIIPGIIKRKLWSCFLMLTFPLLPRRMVLLVVVVVDNPHSMNPLSVERAMMSCCMSYIA